MSSEWQKAAEEIRAANERYYARVDQWWNSLTESEQLDAFYSVVKRIYRGDVEENRSYRGVLYDVFGWSPAAYGVGMECGYLELHNLIGDGLEFKETLRKWELDRINEKLNYAAEHDLSQGIPLELGGIHETSDGAG